MQNVLPYNIHVNDSAIITDGFIGSAYSTAQVYVDRAIQNSFREARNLSVFRSPLAYSDTNGIYYSRVLGRAEGDLTNLYG